MIKKVLAIKIDHDFSNRIYFSENEELTNAEESVFNNLLLVEAYREAKAN